MKPVAYDRHILVVEDERDLLESVVEALEEKGYSTAAAQDGLQALAYLDGSARKPSLIVLDLMMPHMNGAEFRQAQLARPEVASIPVVVVSADAHHLKDRFASLAPAGFLRKPFEIAALLEVIDGALAHASRA